MNDDELKRIYDTVNPDSVARFIVAHSNEPVKGLALSFQYLYFEILKNRRFMHQMALGRKLNGALLGREIESIELLLDEYANSLSQALK